MALYDNGNDSDELPGLPQRRRGLRPVCLLPLPPIPQNIEDVAIEGEWRRNWLGSTFLSHQDNDWGIAIFATAENITNLQRCNKIFIERTYKACPQPYHQLVTVLGKYLGRVFTLVMCLMKGKEIGQYRQVLHHLKQRVRHVTGVRWRPAMAFCDLDLSLFLAIGAELPHTSVRACYFHFRKRLWSKVQDLGLANSYSRRSCLRQVIRKIMAIGQLPVALVEQNLNMLTRDRATRQLVNRYPSLGDFIVYIFNTYIRGTFPVDMWNVFERESDCQINNIVEGFHRRWNSAVGMRHLSLWSFIKKLKDEERRERRRLLRANHGHTDDRQRRKWRVLGCRVNRLKTQYNIGAMELSDYWAAVSRVIKDYC